ncbi:M43 family zinc metalloprotease [Flavobacterium sp.]|uniref:M43 family zinc metalloprotease n=1 Tax=Flavobacterium sp. TaxID=239 RepID=UPI002FDEBF2A
MKKRILALCVVFFFNSNLWSQTNSSSPKKAEASRAVTTLEKNKNPHFSQSVNQARQFAPNGIVKCTTAEHNQELQQRGLAPTDEQFEAWLAPKIQELKLRRQTNPNEVQGVITIPVVIHVIHNGDAYGTGENIRDEQVLSQIQVMNQDFRRMSGTPGFGPGVDVEIEFCLAQTDPNGNPTTGINRVNLGIASFDRAGVEGNLKPNTIWDPTQYLNMWTCRFSGDLNGVLGYAQFPSASGLAGLAANGGAATTDGVIMAYNAFGSSAIYPAGLYLAPYDRGRTTTHEVGHWLGLRHIWGDGGCTVDDFCADTPVAGAANFGCPTGTDSCPTSPGLDQIQNYMDYTDDTCMDRFTQNQKERMLTVMSVSPRRASLASSTKCQAPAPFIQFGNTTGSIIESTNCNYVDVSYPVTIARAATANAEVTFSVTGGTATQNIDYQIVTPSVTFPAGTTAPQNLVVRFFNDGIIESNEIIIIDLVLNANGGNAVLNNAAKTITITIQNDDLTPVSSQVVTLLTEDFEDLTGWLVLDQDGDGNNWGIVNGLNGLGTAPNTIAGRAGYSAKRLNYFGTNSTVNPNNYLISPQVTIPANATSVDLSFIAAAYDDGGPVRNAGDLLVYFTTNITNQATIQGGTLIQTALVVNENTSLLRSYNLNALAGQTGYLVFRHANATANNVGLLLIDNLQLSATVSVDVQTEINLATAYNASLKSSGTLYATDSSTGKVMSGITVNTGFDYGCTTIYVDRSNTSVGGASSLFTDPLVANAVMSKTYRVTSQNDNPTGNYTISFYYTQAEVAAWEAATGKSRNDLYIIKVINNPISAVNPSNFGTFTIESQPVTMSSFGTNVVFQATFSSPLSGGYALGPQTTIINCGDVTSTWNGTSWSNGTPYNKIVAIINGNYNTTINGSLTCCSLTVNSGNVLNIGANTNVTVTGDITVNGTLNVLNNGSLVQIEDTAVNTGNITYERTVSIRKNDYVYWSSPISNFNVNGISPLTNTSFIFKWNPTISNTNGSLGNWMAATGETMVLGKGYIVKGPENFTNTAQNFTATFMNGVPNNGVITIPISRGNYTGVNYNGANGTQITRFDDNWNLIGNPYPSAIRALDFLNLNTNIEGAIRLWTHTTLPSSAISSPFYGTSSSNYTPADYITYNGLGTVSGPSGFNGYIAGGQGFFIQMNDGAATTQNVTFNNSLRSASYANNQFYRSATNENADLVASRIWLDIVDSNNNSDRTLIGYTEGATAAKDRLFDAVTAVGLSMKIYSLIESDLMTIQGKSYPIDVNDEVALGVNIPTSGNYSIAIAALDGIASDLPIYLEDKALNIIHDLRQNPYSFTSNVGQFNDRFVLRYTNETLGNNDFTTNNQVIVISNNTIQVVSNTTSISNVKIFNVVGQLLLDSNTLNSNTFETSKIQKNNTALFVQVTLDNGAKVIKKIIF